MFVPLAYRLLHTAFDMRQGMFDPWYMYTRRWREREIERPRPRVHMLRYSMTVWLVTNIRCPLKVLIFIVSTDKRSAFTTSSLLHSEREVCLAVALQQLQMEQAICNYSVSED